MAIDTAEKRRNVGGNMPTPDGAISIFDRRQIAMNYRGLPIAVAIGGTITPTGVVARALTAYRSFGGTLTPTGVVARSLTAYRSFGGGLTPTGILTPVPIYVQSLGGTLNLSGAVVMANPAWLLIPDNYLYQGNWDVTILYDKRDVVLYKTTDGEYHPYVSKLGHNVGNIPTTAYLYWTRMDQGEWE